MRMISIIALLILVIGGLNWGLVGIWEFNVIDYLLSKVYLDRIAYVIVGISALWVLFTSPMLFARKK